MNETLKCKNCNQEIKQMPSGYLEHIHTGMRKCFMNGTDYAEPSIWIDIKEKPPVISDYPIEVYSQGKVHVALQQKPYPYENTPCIGLVSHAIDMAATHWKPLKLSPPPVVTTDEKEEAWQMWHREKKYTGSTRDAWMNGHDEGYDTGYEAGLRDGKERV